MDNLRLGLFKILEARGLVNYKLRLPTRMRIYLVFYKKLLELALLNAKITIDIELEDDEYKIKEIRDL